MYGGGDPYCLLSVITHVVVVVVVVVHSSTLNFWSEDKVITMLWTTTHNALPPFLPPFLLCRRRCDGLSQAVHSIECSNERVCFFRFACTVGWLPASSKNVLESSLLLHE